MSAPMSRHQLGLRRGEPRGPARPSWFDLSARARPRPVPRLPRHRARTALRAHRPRTSGCGRRWSLLFWVTLKARPVVGAGRRGGARRRHAERRHRGIKAAEERLLHDAVHDNLTGLPNRELFFDRLDSRARHALPSVTDRRIAPDASSRIDIDRFQAGQRQVGPSIGDSILLTMARRLGRLQAPQDTMARIGGDQFAYIILSEQRAGRGDGRWPRRCTSRPSTPR